MKKILKYIIWLGLAGICLTPLIIRGNYFFPYIVPKTIVFRVIVEVIFLAFLVLAVMDKKYRPKLNLAVLLFSLYIVVVSISSILADTFYFSFWSNNERSEGVLLLLHLLMLLIVVSGFLRSFKSWLCLFEISFLSSVGLSLYSLGQYFNLGGFVASSGGERLTATIGNAGYVAGYLIFNIFFGLFLLFLGKNKYLKWYYVSGILLHSYIVLNTLTRGAILSLGFSLFIFAFYFVFFYLEGEKKSYQVVKKITVSLIVFSIFFTGLVFINKDADWVQKNKILERVVSISPKALTAQTRLMTWESAYQGFKEKPILGYGYENFYQVFDKYFNPKIYRKAGSVIWFDRAHNIIFDRLITGGLIGLLLYLALLFAPIFYIWKYFKKREEKNKYLIPVISSLIVVAYFIQNFFIFEALVTYIPLFIVLGFLSQYSPSFKDNFFQSNTPWIVLLTFYFILFIPLMFSFNIKPAVVNKMFVRGLLTAQSQESYKEGVDQLIEVLDKKTFGDQEYRQHFGDLISKGMNNQNIDQNWLAQMAIRGEQEFDKQIEEKPLNARNYLMFMRFLNKVHTTNPARLDKAIELGKRAVELTPTKPHVYYELAYSQVYSGKYYHSINQDEKGDKFFEEAILNMQKSVELQPSVIESYINVIVTLFATKNSDLIQGYLDKMDELDVNWHGEDSLSRMGNSAVYAKQYQWTGVFYGELVKIKSDNPNYWVNLALSYAYLGEREKAVETARKIEQLGEEYKTQSDAFIQDVLSGKYE